MQIWLYFVSLLLIVVVFAHSYLGERHILIRLFRREDLPKVMGSSEFTIRTLRFAWHITSVAWFGFAAIVFSLARPPLDSSTIGLIIGLTFLVHFAISLIGSRGKHLSWPIFLVIGIVVIYATRT